MPRSEKTSIDIYFFGYGHNYKSCLFDYFQLTGNPPLLPRWALGNWWSRYHRYTEQEYISLMEIEEAMKYVLNGAFGVEVSVLILETARIFGFEKTGVKIKQRMSLAVDSLCKKGLVRVSDGKAQLLEV